MATTVARLEAVLGADTKHFDRAIDHSGRTFDRVGKAIKVGALAAGAAVAYGLGKAAKIGFDEFNQGQKVAAQTGAVLKSTGGIANVSAKQIDRLATSLMKKSGVDDEVIKSGQNMLLTFTKIRNEAGKGNDIFNQATKATLNLSVAMGKDMQSSSILVGKALNDPIKGVTALTRAGVQLTEEQKNTIKALVEMGDTAGAQKIILKELETQFGGSAEAAGKTFAGQMNILKETFSNFAGEIVGRFAPALMNAAQVVLPLVLQALDAIGKLIGDHVAPKVQALSDVVRNNWPKIQEIAQRIFHWIRDNVFPIVNGLRDIFVAMAQRMGEVMAEHGPELRRIFERLGEAMTNIWKVVGPLLRIFFVEVLPVAIGIAITALDKVSFAIEQIIKGIKWLYEQGRAAIEAVGKSKAWDIFLEAVDKIATVIGKIVSAVKWLIDNIGRIPDIPGVGRSGGGPSSSNSGLIPMVENAVGAARSMGWSGQVTSGFRTYEEQSRLYQRYLRGGPLAAPPGTSSHERGQAVDVTDYGVFGQMMSRLPHGLRLYNKLGARDPVHFSVTGYARGGIVPGPVGMPQLAMVHGGETITPPGEQTINLYVDGQKLFSWFRDAEAKHIRRNG